MFSWLWSRTPFISIERYLFETFPMFSYYACRGDALLEQAILFRALKLPMAGLEPARANYGPTDFKSVASTIPPHRRCDVHSKLLPIPAKMDFAVKTDFKPS